MSLNCVLIGRVTSQHNELHKRRNTLHFNLDFEYFLKLFNSEANITRN